MGLFSKTEETPVEEPQAPTEIHVEPADVFIASDGLIRVSLFNKDGDTDIIQEFHADDLGEEASEALLALFGTFGKLAAIMAMDELRLLEAKIRGLTNG